MVRKSVSLGSTHPQTASILRQHVPQHPRFLHPTAHCSRSTESLALAHKMLKTGRSGSLGEGWVVQGVLWIWTLVHLSHAPLPYDTLPPHHPRNSPSRQAQEVQKRKADPGAQRDRGYLLDRNHLRNMPYFKPVHVSRLSRCPVQGARRGQSGSRGVRTLALTLARAHTRPRSASPAAVGVCVHAARGGGTCAPAPSLAARAQFERSLGSTPHLVAPARAALQRTWELLPREARQVWSNL